MLLKIYCENIVIKFLNQDFLFFILFFFLSFHFHPYIHFFFFSFFTFFSPPHVHCPVSYLYPLLLFSFSPQEHSRHQERERERRKDKAGGDRGHRKDRVNAALPRPPLVLLPTTRPGQIGFLVLSLFFFSYLLVL